MAAVFFYISGHGYGHAARQIEILNALGAARPDLRIVVRTSAPRWLFERTARVPLTLVDGECDTGVVQIDSLRLDEAETIRRAGDFYRTLTDRAAAEAEVLAAHDAAFVVADAPPLGCAAAASAGIPSVVVANFTWDWIYEAYASHLADAPELLPSIRRAYWEADEAWRLPLHGGFETFDTVIDVPFVARHKRHAREEVRDLLGLPRQRPLVLSSFGYGVNGLDVTRLDCLDRYGLVITYRNDDELIGGAPAGLYQVSESTLYGRGLRYEDLVGACDVVATKPGYGIISECIANDAAILYTSRGHFAEYEVLASGMPTFLRCGYIDHEQLFAGAWRAALDRIMSAPSPPERPATNGAEVVAQMIASRTSLS